VIASEIDREMASIVESRLGDRVHLVLGDCLDRRRHLSPEILEALGDRPFRMVANLPYQAATPLLMDLLIRRPNCLGQVALIQKEVADRLASDSGCREYGPISAITAVLGSIRRVTVVSPGCFWPQPKVTSAVVAIVPNRDHGVEDPEAFADFVGDLFRTRRKQIGTILGRDRIPPGFDPILRPEQLRPETLLALYRACRCGGPTSEDAAQSPEG
jgi:16S rRNA (adenine1518-N6/adenine1519-N6)-dimethyltransferase